MVKAAIFIAAVALFAGALSGLLQILAPVMFFVVVGAVVLDWLRIPVGKG